MVVQSVVYVCDKKNAWLFLHWCVEVYVVHSVELSHVRGQNFTFVLL